MANKMRQDGGKMRKMKDVSSVLGPPGRYGPVHPANSGASRGPGEGREGLYPLPWYRGKKGVK